MSDKQKWDNIWWGCFWLSFAAVFSVMCLSNCGVIR